AIEKALGADLEQHFAAVMRVFLHDSVIVTGNIYVVVFVQDAAVNGGWSGLKIPERIDQIAVGIIFKDGRRWRSDQLFLVLQIAAVHLEYVVPRIHANPAGPPGDHEAWQWLGPCGIYFVFRNLRLY